ncbi:MAG: amidohydrolase family protein, partial [Pseudomonadota bacterium]|nr:amidohydrolase family protein [Pseudomonadota bacterium]
MKKTVLAISLGLACLTSLNTYATTYLSAKAMVDVNSGKLIKSPLISIDNGQITAVQSNKQPSLKD